MNSAVSKIHAFFGYVLQFFQDQISRILERLNAYYNCLINLAKWLWLSEIEYFKLEYHKYLAIVTGLINGIQICTHKVFNFFGTFNPNNDFLTDVATFAGVVVAIAFPVSLEIISKISERYESDIISEKFTNLKVVKFYPSFVIANVIIAVSYKFFIPNDSNGTPSIACRFISWFLLVGFIITAIALSYFYIELKKFISNTDYILRKLYDEAKKSIE